MNVNHNPSTCAIFVAAILTAATSIGTPVSAQQEDQQHDSSADPIRAISQQTGGKVVARHVVGLESVKRNLSGNLIVIGSDLQFQADKVRDNLPLASIDNISVGTEITQAGGRAGTVAKTAAIAAPYDSGAALSILLRTTVDTLTVSSRDSRGGLHYAILALPKGKGEQERAGLIAAGAHVRESPSEGSNKPIAPEPPKPIATKLSASAIQIEPVEAGEVTIPTEFRAAIYEYLVMRVRESGSFQQVLRSGDQTAVGMHDLVKLHTTVKTFKQGSQMEREITTVLGSTNVGVDMWVTDLDGHVLRADLIHGRVRFFGENLGATNDLAKRIAKRLKQK